MIGLAPALACWLIGAGPSPAAPAAAADPLAQIRAEADDARLAALRDEYHRRRAAAGSAAADQARLADWCGRLGLADEARAHLTAASRLRPDDAGLHARLGERRYQGAWMRPEEVEAIRAEAKAQADADDRWAPLLAGWRDDLADPKKRPAAVQALGAIRDDRAAPAIDWTFGGAEGWEQAWAARLFGRLDGPRATRELAGLAVFGRDEPVRAAAVASLVERDPRGFVGLLINWLRDPIRFEAEGDGAGDRSPALLRVEGDRSIVERTYRPFAVDPAARDRPADFRSGPFRPVAGSSAEATGDFRRRAREATLDRLDGDIRSLEAANSKIRRMNARVEGALVRVTGEPGGRTAREWTLWWTAELGYSPSVEPEPLKPHVSEVVPVPLAVAPSIPAPAPAIPPQAIFQVGTPRGAGHSCFAAGTPVLTRSGPRAIETIEVGDQVWSERPGDGPPAFRPVLAAYHNRPAMTLRVAIGADVVVATPIHRFWAEGKGWTMARDLRPGDAIRSLGSTAIVRSVAPDVVRPVFNLEVADGHSFFVGDGRFLAHDQSLVGPKSPRPALAAAAGTVRPAGR